MIASALILGIADGLAQGLVTNYQTKKLANAYKDAAKQVRGAAQKYSGKEADTAMTQEGERQGQQMQKLAQSQGVTGTTGLSTADATASTNNNSGLSAYMQGQNLGRGNKATELNSKYNAATVDAQNMLNKAKTDFNVGQATSNLVFNTLGGLGKMGGDIGMNGATQALGNGAGNLSSGFSTGMNNMANSASSMFSDENCKESITNESGDKIPKADVEDALRQIQSIEYQYKPETGLDQDKHVGISAQSVEGTALDNGMVNSEPGKFKTLDKQKLLESVMAGIAAMQKEIDELRGVKVCKNKNKAERR